MKKISFLVFLSIALLSFVACASVDKKADNIGNTEALSETGVNVSEDKNNIEIDGEADGDSQTTSKHIRDIDVSTFYKGVEFEVPEDLRQAAVDYMYEQASVEWVCAQDFGVKEEWATWGINLDFRAGVTYKGQPYANSQVNVNLFKRALVDGTYTSPSSSWDDVHGSQCVSSIMNAVQQVMIVDGWSYSFNPGSVAYQAKKLGDYKVTQMAVNSERPTIEVCKDNGETVMYEAYALAQKGDVILTANSWLHARMVVEVNVDRNAAGVINPRRSYFKCIEQTNSFDKTRTDGVNTTWYVDHIYTFEKLYQDGYLPSTFEVYETGVTHIPYITLDAKNTPELLAKSTLVGNVRSNYPLRYVVLEVFDKNGDTVKEYVVRGSMEDYVFGLRQYSYNLFGSGLQKGEYTFVLTAGIAAGEYEFERIEFVVK